MPPKKLRGGDSRCGSSNNHPAIVARRASIPTTLHCSFSDSDDTSTFNQLFPQHKLPLLFHISLQPSHLLHIRVGFKQVIHRGHAKRIPISIIHKVMPHVIVSHLRKQPRQGHRQKEGWRRSRCCYGWWSNLCVNNVVTPFINQSGKSISNRGAEAIMPRQYRPQYKVCGE